MATLGQRVRKKRLTENVTQAQLASLMGASQAQIARVEDGTRDADAGLEARLTRWLSRTKASTSPAKRGAYGRG